MGKFAALFLFLLLTTKISAQENKKISEKDTYLYERTKIEFEIVKNGKVEKGMGYFISHERFKKAVYSNRNRKTFY